MDPPPNPEGKTAVEEPSTAELAKEDPSTTACSSNKTANPSLLGLPRELQSQIIDNLQRLSDLLNVALSCHLLNSVTIPILYDDIHVDIGGPQDSQVQRIFSPRNRGLQHIKHLSLRADESFSRQIWLKKMSAQSSEPDDSKDPDLTGFYHSAPQAQLMLGMILELLPRDQLHSFSWNTWDVLTLDNWLDLYTSQTQLRSIDISALDKPLLPAIKKDPRVFQRLEHVNALYIWPNNEDTLEAAQLALQYKPNIDLLLLNCTTLRNQPEVAGPMEDSSTAPGFISRTLFKHLSPFEKCTPMTLRELHITGYDMHHASTTILRVIDFTSLESLVLDESPGAASVFAEMGKSYARPTKLKRVCWIEKHADRHSVKTFESFLQSFKGLRYIHVDLASNAELLKPLAIKNHGDTLLSLFVRYESHGQNGPRYDSAQLVDITERCQQLRQLSLPFQDLHAHEGWSYENDDIQGQVAAIRKLPDLNSLCIQDWPTTNITSDNLKKDENRQYYAHQLSWVATRLFRSADAYAQKQCIGSRSKLARIAFGIGSSYYGGPETLKLEQAVFMRGQQTDPYGRKVEVAIHVGKQGLRDSDEDESIIGWESGPVFNSLRSIVS